MTNEQAFEEFMKGSDNTYSEPQEKKSITLDLGDDPVIYHQAIDFTDPVKGMDYEGFINIKRSNIFETMEVAKNLKKFKNLMEKKDEDMFNVDLGIVEVLEKILLVKDKFGHDTKITDPYLSLKLFTAIMQLAGPSLRADSNKAKGSAIAGAKFSR